MECLLALLRNSTCILILTGPHRLSYLQLLHPLFQPLGRAWQLHNSAAHLDATNKLVMLLLQAALAPPKTLCASCMVFALALLRLLIFACPSRLRYLQLLHPLLQPLCKAWQFHTPLAASCHYLAQHIRRQAWLRLHHKSVQDSYHI